MARKDSEAYSIFEGIYVFLVLFPILISLYQLFSKYIYLAIIDKFAIMHYIQDEQKTSFTV